LLRNAVQLPGGTVIRGVPAEATVLLLPPSNDVTKSAASSAAELKK
jgi:hypothetical protein